MLRAQLLPDQHKVEGNASIDFVNSASAPVQELVFHLYANAFESDDTVFAREGGFGLRDLALRRRGGIELSSLTTGAGQDLLASAERELVPDDRTQLRVRLPAPVAPGERLAITTRFVVTLPSLVARMGQAGDFAMVAQWFPKLGKLMPDGGWRSTPYRGAGEFDADFADYDLTVLVPSDYVIAAPGVPKPVREQPPKGLRAERYAMSRVLDIAWAAAPDLQRVEHEAASQPFAVEAFAPRGAHALATRQAELAAHALGELSALLGPYPHDRLVIVIPPAEALGAAGMEYPGLIVGWTASSWAALFPAASAHDVVTTHEVAHQWFPMLVASDEVAHPVLDEGLAEWLGLHLLRDRYGHASERSVLGISAAHLVGLPLDAFDVTAASLATHYAPPSSWLAAYEVELSELAFAMYLRPTVALEALAEQHGRARLLHALGVYARAHRYGHVGPEDLQHALDAEYGAAFSNRVFVPTLAGEPTKLMEHKPSPEQADAARSLPARLLALAQLALGWIAL